MTSNTPEDPTKQEQTKPNNKVTRLTKEELQRRIYPEPVWVLESVMFEQMWRIGRRFGLDRGAAKQLSYIHRLILTSPAQSGWLSKDSKVTSLKTKARHRDIAASRFDSKETIGNAFDYLDDGYAIVTKTELYLRKKGLIVSMTRNENERVYALHPDVIQFISGVTVKPTKGFFGKGGKKSVGKKAAPSVGGLDITPPKDDVPKSDTSSYGGTFNGPGGSTLNGPPLQSEGGTFNGPHSNQLSNQVSNQPDDSTSLCLKTKEHDKDDDVKLTEQYQQMVIDKGGTTLEDKAKEDIQHQKTQNAIEATLDREPSSSNLHEKERLRSEMVDANPRPGHLPRLTYDLLTNTFHETDEHTFLRLIMFTKKMIVCRDGVFAYHYMAQLSESSKQWFKKNNQKISIKDIVELTYHDRIIGGMRDKKVI